jgi:hypothetical protein
MEQAEGCTIQPLISAGKTEVPPEYAEATRTRTTWNEQLDEIFVRWAMKGGEDGRLDPNSWEILPKANARIGGCS